MLVNPNEQTAAVTLAHGGGCRQASAGVYLTLPTRSP